MEEKIKFSAVNIDAKALEEQNENLKKSNNVQIQKKTSFDPKNYLDLKLKEHEATKTVKVRFLPISASDGTVFFDIITHALKVDKEIAKSGFKSFVCLNDKKTESTEECPICKKSKELFEKASKARQEGNESLSKALFKQACSLKKKRTFITRVIDRDHEDEGVKFWRFNENSQGKGIYDILMALFSKSLIPDGFGGMKETIAYNITDSGNRKPLSKDIDKANAWLNDEKTWRDVYSLKSADYLELVVDGKIPVYSKELGKYVEKTEFDKEAKQNEEAAAEEVLRENNTEFVNNSIDNDDDLPF